MANDAPGVAAPVVALPHGRLRGAIVEGIAAFKSVPYGAPTGAARFLPPAPPAPWTGLRDATDYAGHAPQMGLRPPSRPELADLYGVGDSSPPSEDCLTLNVWTPAVGDGARRPVMVWLHGGAFSYGTGNGERSRGSRLCQRGDVVVVSVNHRLNILGFLDLSAVGGPDYAASGNAGMLDIVAALQWVQDNIAAFGGDPDCVTVFGESGGGGKVCTLMAMPAAKGVFHRAVVQSGGAVLLRTPARAARLTDAVLRELATDVAGLRDMPLARLLAAIGPAIRALGPAARPLLDRYPFGPVVDGTILPRQPFAPDATPLSADIPLLIGDMKDEAASFVATDDTMWFRRLDEAGLLARVTALAGDAAPRVIAAYRAANPAMNPAELLIAIRTDAEFRVRSLLVAERQAALRGAPVFMYSFEWETPVHDGRLKAPHALDVPFTFDTLDLTRAHGDREDARRLSGIMAETWIAFARTGRPSHAALPDWPAFDTASRATMVLDSACRLAHDPRPHGRTLWQELAAG
ncbi:MAG: carboxylesterase/lipase family protein [Acetobacteraceae bacterium]|nr:carboxylesterase/lipase family protein [Acetobacteraceae bacterium]